MSPSSARWSPGRTRPAWSAAGCRRWPAPTTRRRWSWPAAAAGRRRAGARQARGRPGGGGWAGEMERAPAGVPAGLTLLRPGYLPLDLLAGLLGEAELVA